MYDTPVLPWYFGGNGSVDHMFKNLPFTERDPYLLEFTLVFSGYTLEDMVYLNFFKERSSDYWEMNFHHLITLTWFSGVVFQNSIRAGFLTAWVHNLSDILTSLSRVLS